MNENGKRYSDGLKALFIVVGAIVTIGAVVAVLYSLFKKYFKITFETGADDCCDCFGDDCGCEPICYCGDDDADFEEEIEEL